MLALTCRNPELTWKVTAGIMQGARRKCSHAGTLDTFTTHIPDAQARTCGSHFPNPLSIFGRCCTSRICVWSVLFCQHMSNIHGPPCAALLEAGSVGEGEILFNESRGGFDGSTDQNGKGSHDAWRRRGTRASSQFAPGVSGRAPEAEARGAEGNRRGEFRGLSPRGRNNLEMVK